MVMAGGNAKTSNERRLAARGKIRQKALTCPVT